MAKNIRPEDARPGRQSMTTRRGFVAGLSLGGVSLYGLWAAYGAAPLTFSSRSAEPAAAAHGDGHPGATPAAPEHGGHGESSSTLSPEEFRNLVDDFVARGSLPDGTVSPDLPEGEATGTSMSPGTIAHGTGGHAPADTRSSLHGDRRDQHSVGTGGAREPATVYLAVQQWMFEPAALRLKAGVPYRFRMMALDVSHGASLQLGPASRIIRLRPGVLDEREIAFSAPGEYLVYCTVYCGAGHDQMYGKIIVA